MRTSTRRHVAFAFGLSAVIAMSGFLLNAAPPQAVGTWEVLGTTDPSSARSGAATATLEDDTTLIAGGRMVDGTVTDSVLIYDPTTNASTVVGQLASPRVNGAAARLDDGRVLIVGGEIADLLSADAEIFDPSTGTSTVVANMAAPRTRHAATRLADGKVLIVGGVTLEGVTLATAEVFDPETGSILEAGSMTTPRAGASVTLLIDNRVLVAGGNDGTQDLASAELFYPATQEFFPVETALSQARAGHTAVLLPHNGAVLIAGGTAAGAPVATTDLFLPTMFPDPYTWSMGTFGPAEHLTHARSHAVSGPMGDDGYAFVAGGGAAEGEAYAFVTLKTDKDDYAPGEFALITGSGWQPGEEVTLVFQEDPAVHPDYTLTLTADGEGNISHEDWAPEVHDLNVRFYLMATGVQSHRRAQITFTDGSIRVRARVSGSNIAVSFPAGAVVAFGNATCSAPAIPPSSAPAFSTTSAGNGYGDALISVSSGSFSATAPSPVTISGTTYEFASWVSDNPNAHLASTSGSTGCFDNLGNGATGLTANYTVVAHLATTTSISAPSISYGDNGSVTVTVTPNSGSSTPTGSVSLSVDGGTSVSGTLSGGSYTFTGTDVAALISPNATVHSLSASYAGATGFLASGPVGGTLTVEAKPLTVTAGNRLKTYGETVTFDGTEFTTTALVGTDSVTSVTLTSTGAAAGATVTAPGPTYPIVASLAVGTGLDNYAINYVDGTLTVEAKLLTVTADSRSKTYGDTATFLGTEFTTTALVGTDSVTSVTLTSTGAAASATVTAPGPTYPIVASLAVGTGLDNYAINYVDGVLTVNTKPLTVTANSRSKTYGDTVTFLGTEFTTTALVGTDAVTSVTLTSTGAAAGATVTAPGPTYPIVPSLAVGAGLDNYAIDYVDGTLTVEAKPLTVTANSRSKTYGDTATFLGTEFTTTALVGADSVTNVTLTSTGAAASATVTAPGPTFPIVASLAVGTGLDNYAINYVDGVLTVNTKPLTVTANSRSKTYGDTATFLGTEFTTTALVGTDAVTSVTLTSTGAAASATVTAPGPTYPIVASLPVGTGLGNYAIDYVDGTLTVNTKQLTVTANSFSKVLGATYTFLGSEFTNGSLVAGDSVTSVTLASPGAAAGAAIGSYPIVASAAVGTGLGNYAINYEDGTLTILYATTGLCLGSPGHQVLQPLNVDGSSVVKKGSTVPVKFRVCDANGNSIGTPGVVTGFQLVQVINGTTEAVTEEPISTTPDMAFRWSATDQQWIFNLSTKNLSAGKTYVYEITLNDTSVIRFQFGTKQ